VVLISGFERQSPSSGPRWCVDRISKPFNITEIKRIVDRALDEPNLPGFSPSVPAEAWHWSAHAHVGGLQGLNTRPIRRLRSLSW
jgi:hypothetical protein